MVFQEVLTYHTRGRGTYDLTSQVERIVAGSGVQVGLCHVFLHHTSASLILCENADVGVRSDLEAFMARLVPDGDPLFRHTAEGPDDMPAHVRNVLTQTGIAIPVSGGHCALGTWQSIYLWEHRKAGHRRNLTVTVHGE
jgi:secondary thiamine-phosphate synthase enzyme